MTFAPGRESEKWSIKFLLTSKAVTSAAIHKALESTMEEEFCLQAKNPASSCVHSLLSLILKHSRRALVIAKTWRGLTKQDVNPVLRFRLTEETWKCSHLKQVLPNAFISHKCYFSFSLLLPFLFLLFFFLPFLAFFWPPTTNICIICYRTLYPVTP